MGEKEVYSTFYGGLTVDSKNDLNIAAQGNFSQTPFTQAKNILEKLIEAKRSYETSRGRYGRKGAVHAVEAHNDERLEARFEQIEKKLLEAVEKAKAPPTAKAEEHRYVPPPPPQEHHYYYCEFHLKKNNLLKSMSLVIGARMKTGPKGSSEISHGETTSISDGVIRAKASHLTHLLNSYSLLNGNALGLYEPKTDHKMEKVIGQIARKGVGPGDNKLIGQVEVNPTGQATRGGS